MGISFLKHCRCDDVSHTFHAIQIICLLLILGSFIIDVGAQETEEIMANISDIEITRSVSDFKIPDRTFYVWSSGINVTEVKVFREDLLEQGKERWIPHSSMTITPETFDLYNAKAQNLTLKFNIKQLEPGIYTGGLLFMGENFSKPLLRIPVTMTIHADTSLAIMLVSLGVAANFVLKFTRWKVTENQASEEAIRVAEDAMNQADDQDKKQNNKYVKAVTNLRNAQIEHQLGNYQESKRKASRARDLFQQALSSQIEVLDQVEGSDFKMNVREKIRQFGISSLWRSDYAVYIALTIVLAISVMQVWQLFFPKVAAFGTSGIDYVAAFLFGYASEALLSEAVDFAKRLL